MSTATNEYTSLHYQILRGPSELDMMRALFPKDRHSKEGVLTFSVLCTAPKCDETILEVRLTELKSELHTDSCWKFGGLVENTFAVTIEGVYDHKTRKGRATVEYPTHDHGTITRHCKKCRCAITDDADCVSYDPANVLEGVICCECDLERAQSNFFYEQDEWNEDPLEGAVEPVGGAPSKDKPFYDRDGMLIGHVPIEVHIFDDEDYDF